MKKITHQENEALGIVFKLEEANIKTIVDNLPQPLPYTTVASTIKNLEKKGYLKSRLVGNTNLYSPAITEAEFKKSYMGEIVKGYFDNSYKDVVNFFVEQKKLSAKELKEILSMIEKGK